MKLMWLVAAVHMMFFEGQGGMPSNFRGVVRGPAGEEIPVVGLLVQRWDWDKSYLHATPIGQTIPADSKGQFAVYLPPGLYDVFVSHPLMEPVALKVEIAPVTPSDLECDLQLSPLVPTQVQFVTGSKKPGPPVVPSEPRPSACRVRKTVAP